MLIFQHNKTLQVRNELLQIQKKNDCLHVNLYNDQTSHMIGKSHDLHCNKSHMTEPIFHGYLSWLYLIVISLVLAELTITLLDVNDNPPQFLPSDVYYARISEASRTGSEVKQVQAVDADKSHGIISYYMVKFVFCVLLLAFQEVVMNRFKRNSRPT